MWPNRAVAANPPGAVSAGAGVHTFYAVSGDGGLTWTVQQVTTAATMPRYEQCRAGPGTSLGTRSPTTIEQT